MVGVLRSAGNDEHLGFGQAEAKESSADKMIKADAARRVGTFGKHGTLYRDGGAFKMTEIV